MTHLIVFQFCGRLARRFGVHFLLGAVRLGVTLMPLGCQVVKARKPFIGLLVVLSGITSGCGGGSYSQGGLYPVDRSGAYSFTLTWSGGSFTFHGTLKQTQWTPCNGNLLCNGATYENNLTGSFSFPWCSPDSFNATGQLFYTPGGTESFAFAVGDTTTSSNLFTMSSPDFSTLSGPWQPGPAFTCPPVPSGSLSFNWTAVKN